MTTPQDNPFAAPPKPPARAAMPPLPSAAAPQLPPAPKLAATPGANLYAAPRAAVMDLDVDDDAEPASRFARLRAAIIDVMIYIVAGLPVAALGGKPLGIGLSIAVFIGLLAWNAVLLARNGQTIGKKACDIRIVRTDGSDASFSRLFFLRMVLTWMLNMVPFAGSLFGIADVLFIFREDRRCLHDLIADTKVVEAGSD